MGALIIRDPCDSHRSTLCSGGTLGQHNRVGECMHMMSSRSGQDGTSALVNYTMELMCLDMDPYMAMGPQGSTLQCLND